MMRCLCPLLAALALNAAGCANAGDAPEDSAPAGSSGGEAASDATPNTLLTSTAAGPYELDGTYELSPMEDYFVVDFEENVQGISLDGETLCEIQVLNDTYRTADGVGRGSRIGDLGEPGVDLHIEEATGDIFVERLGFSVTPTRLGLNDQDGSDVIDPDATVRDIRLGGCGE